MNDQQPPLEPNTKSASVSSSGSWALGLVIVFIGALLLARNLGINLAIFEYDNWWAIFILLASLAPLSRALRLMVRGGWSMEVANALVSAAAIITLGLLILLDLSVLVWWPVFLIIGGLYMMTNKASK